MTGSETSPYEHLADALPCVHTPQAEDRDGHYPSRRGPAFADPVTRDRWDAQLDARDADGEERWWAEKRVRQGACDHENIETTWIESLRHTVWRCADPPCGDGGVVGRAGTHAHPNREPGPPDDPAEPGQTAGQVRADRDRAFDLLRWLADRDPKLLRLLVEISEPAEGIWLDDVLHGPAPGQRIRENAAANPRDDLREPATSDLRGGDDD